MDRDRAVTVRMTDTERTLLGELAEAYGLSISDVVRQLIRKDHETRFGAGKKKL